MARLRRPTLPLEAQRQLRDIRLRLGTEVRSHRIRRGWTQADVAARARLGRHVVGAIERGQARVDLDALERIALAFGRPLRIEFGRDPQEAPTDAGHLAMQELVLRLGRATGYRAGFELPTRSADPWRSIDVALRDDHHRRLVIVECWNTIGDIGVAVRSSQRKRAEAGDLAIAWWGVEPSSVHLVWVVRSTARNRRLVAGYPEVFASRFPASSRAWAGALLSGTSPPNEPGLVWCDLPATRLFAWRAPARSRAPRPAVDAPHSPS